MDAKLHSISIRTDLRPGDVGYITYMHGVFYDFMPEFELYVAETLADFIRHLNPDKERLWIAEDDGKIVGTLALKKTDGFAQLRYFLIDPTYRGIGLGQQMMKLFMEFMKACDYKKSFLLTEGNLHVAAALYAKYGYRFVSETVNDYGLEERRYELVLNQD